MRNHVCWRPEALSQAMDTEALQTKPHFFLACHSPVEMKRADRMTGQAGRVAVTQEELLDELLRPESTHVQVVVLGESGTGKSHLVRWMYLRCPDTDARRIVLVPKSGTNLRRVILSILEGMEGPPFDDLRDRVERATAALTPERARQELLGALAINVGSAGPHSSEPWRQPDRQGDHEDIVRMLPALLNDEAFRQPLLADGGTADLIARSIVGTPGYERREEKRVFTEQDFVHEDSVTRAQKMGDVARELYQEIQDDRDIRAHVVEWVNRNLDATAQRLLGLGGDDLTRLMMDLREELETRGQELVLFVEDFAKTEGIQMELLEALMTRPAQEGRRLCVLRSVVAMTTGYYTGLHETVRTRVDSAVNLDVEYSDTRRWSHLAQFSARYLNAVRLSEDALIEWCKDDGGGAPPSQSTLPLACGECQHQLDCHKAFGTVQETGLYPFNQKALGQLYDLAASSATFNPRVLLNDVLLKVLRLHEELRAGTFPPSGLLPPGAGSMDAQTQQALRTSVGPELLDRYRVLLELWADPRKLRSLRSAVLEAFGVECPSTDDDEEGQDEHDEPEDGEEEESDENGDDEEEKGHDARGHDLPEAATQIIGALDGWARGLPMAQPLLHAMREPLWRAATESIDWDSEMLLAGEFRGGQAPFRAACLNFEGQVTKPTGAFQLQLPLPGWDRLQTALALQAMVRYRHFGHWGFDGADEAYTQYTELLTELSRHTVRRLREAHGGDDGSDWDPVRSCVQLLAVGACLRGDGMGQNFSAGEQMSALVYDWGSTPEEVQDHRSPSWRRLQDAFRKYGPKVRSLLLARTGCTKGGSSQFQILDAAACLTHLKAYLSNGEVPDALPDQVPAMYQDVKRLRDRVEQFLAPALDAETSRARTWLARVREQFGGNTDQRALTEVVGATIQAATEAGVGAWTEEHQQRLFRLAREFAELPVDSQMELVERLNDLPTPLAKTRALASEQLVKVMTLSDGFISKAVEMLEAVERRVATDLKNLKTIAQGQVTIEQVEAALGELCTLLADICGEECPDAE